VLGQARNRRSRPDDGKPAFVPASRQKAAPLTFAEKKWATVTVRDRKTVQHEQMAKLMWHDPSKAPIAPQARFVENGVQLPLGSALWKTASGRGTYSHYFADTTAEQAGFIGTLREHGQGMILVLRLAVQQGKIAEIEQLAIRTRNVDEYEKLKMDPLWLAAVRTRSSCSRAVDASEACWACASCAEAEASAPAASRSLRSASVASSRISPRSAIALFRAASTSASSASTVARSRSRSASRATARAVRVSASLRSASTVARASTLRCRLSLVARAASWAAPSNADFPTTKSRPSWPVNVQAT